MVEDTGAVRLCKHGGKHEMVGWGASRVWRVTLWRHRGGEDDNNRVLVYYEAGRSGFVTHYRKQ